MVWLQHNKGHHSYVVQEKLIKILKLWFATFSVDWNFLKSEYFFVNINLKKISQCDNLFLSGRIVFETRVEKYLQTFMDQPIFPCEYLVIEEARFQIRPLKNMFSWGLYREICCGQPSGWYKTHLQILNKS